MTGNVSPRHNPGLNRFRYKLVENEREFQGAIEVRYTVFVHEQGVHEAIEADGADHEAVHTVVLADRDVIGTARVRFLSPSEAKIERMAVLKPYRGQGIGHGILAFLSGELEKRHIKRIVLHAQYPTIMFYKSCGFHPHGRPFLEAGMKHLAMERQLL